MQIELRNCCEATRSDPRPAHFANAPGEPNPHTEQPVAVTREEAPRRMPTAIHEAGHAIIGLILGYACFGATMNVQPSASVFEMDAVPVVSEIAMSLAGPVAQRWHGRFIYRASEADLAPFLDRTRAGTGGWCDYCRCARAADRGAAEHGVAPIDVFRQAEDLTAALVQEPSVWRAIRAVADILMQHGEASDRDCLGAWLDHVDPSKTTAIKERFAL